VEQVVRLVRSKGVGIFFVTQSPKDVPADILGQLGNRVQHALRAFTPDDEKALRAAARTFPKTPFYDVQEILTTLGTGEALITTLTAKGAPTPPFATRLIPPAAQMSPLAPDTMAARLAGSKQVRIYATAVDRESAREMLAERAADAAKEAAEEAANAPIPVPTRTGRTPKAPPTMAEQVLKSPLTRTVVGTITRTLMGALFGAPRRRR